MPNLLGKPTPPPTFDELLAQVNRAVERLHGCRTHETKDGRDATYLQRSLMVTAQSMVRRRALPDDIKSVTNRVAKATQLAEARESSEIERLRKAKD